MDEGNMNSFFPTAHLELVEGLFFLSILNLAKAGLRQAQPERV